MSREVKASIGTDPYRTEVSIGPHALIADEPGDLGGQDTGPAPSSLLLASIATCKAITARMYAERKGWPVERIDAHAFVAAATGHLITKIDVKITVVGDLTEEQRERVLGIAEKCPVQKAVSAGVEINSTLV